MTDTTENTTATQPPPVSDAPADDAAVEVVEPQLPPAVDGPKAKAPTGQVDILLDSTMTISASLGEGDIQVRDLLSLAAGSVVKVNRQIGEPIDLYLRGIKFATGYLVVVGDQLGVRIKDILPPPAGV